MSTGLNRLQSGHDRAGKWPGRAPASVTSTSARGGAFLTGAHCQQSINHICVCSHLAVGLLLRVRKVPWSCIPASNLFPRSLYLGTFVRMQWEVPIPSILEEFRGSRFFIFPPYSTVPFPCEYLSSDENIPLLSTKFFDSFSNFWDEMHKTLVLSWLYPMIYLPKYW